MDKYKSQLIGHLMADGHVPMYKGGTISYCQKKENNIKDFEILFKRVYDVNYSIKKINNKFIFRCMIEKVRKDLLSYVDSYYSYHWKIPKEIMNNSNEIKRAFLNAFIIDEGHRTSINRVQISSINEKGIKQLTILSKSLGEYEIIKLKHYVSKVKNKPYNHYSLILMKKNLTPMLPNTNMRILESTKERLKKKLRPGDSFNSIVERLLDKEEKNK